MEERAGSVRGPRTRASRFVAIGILSVVVFSTWALSVGPASAGATKCRLTHHAPILIQADGDFTAANGVVSGSGTAADPTSLRTCS